jgi:hypothetical protein
MRKAGQGRLDRPMLLDGHRRPRLTFRKEAAGPAAPNEHRPVYGVPSGTIRQRALNLPPLCQRALDELQGWIEGDPVPETSTRQGFKDYPIPQSIPDGHLVPQPGLLDNMNEINGLTEGITPECFCYAIDFMK